MPEPLDYFTPRRPGQPDPPERGESAPSAIPIEFDTLLTQTPDHAAARAIEAELTRQGIPFFRTEGAGRARRLIELHVRSADHVRASQLAAATFARRQRLDKISPRRPPPKDEPPSSGGTGFPGLP
jgi:hypothetical protein